jgi:hypothetical protein
MLRRLIMLLIFALAVPAAATPACASDPSVERAHDGSAHQAPQKKQERQRRNADAQCIGCVAPSTTNPPMIEAPVPGLMMIPAAGGMAQMTGRPLLPATPPPRLQA